MKNKKQWIIAISIILVLAIALAVLLTMYDFDSETDSLSVVQGEVELLNITVDDIIDSEYYVEIEASLNESGSAAKTVTYGGISLANLLKSVETSDCSSIIAYAYDGVVKGYDSDELDNIFIAVTENGDMLESREDGGYGPIMLIEIESIFSQNWCKYLNKIELE